MHSTCTPILTILGANFQIYLSNEKFHLKSQHDSNHLASNLQMSFVTSYEAHHKTTDDHTSDTERTSV